VNITEKRPEQPTAEGDPPAGSQQLGPFTRKRKLPSLFQTSRKTSPSPEMDLPTILDSPDSPIYWGRVGNERNLSEEPSPILDKGKGRQIIEQPTSATYAADRDELERERRIRAEHRVTANEPISASAPIAALQTHHDNALLVTPPIQTRPIQHSPTDINHLYCFATDILTPTVLSKRIRLTELSGTGNAASSDNELCGSTLSQLLHREMLHRDKRLDD
jgi:hypothetical protein